MTDEKREKFTPFGLEIDVAKKMHKQLERLPVHAQQRVAMMVHDSIVNNRPIPGPPPPPPNPRQLALDDADEFGDLPGAAKFLK